MNSFRKVYTIAFLFTLVQSGLNTVAAQSAKSKYKCMVQLTNYMGDGAYIVVSLIDPKDGYEKTLYVMGADKKWYTSLKEWYKFHNKKNADISAITGASVKDGDRNVATIEIDNTKLNKGYKLRFETAVEDKKYYTKDVEVPLTTEALSGKTDGTGYIRYVRLIPN